MKLKKCTITHWKYKSHNGDNYFIHPLIHASVKKMKFFIYLFSLILFYITKILFSLLEIYQLLPGFY